MKPKPSEGFPFAANANTSIPMEITSFLPRTLHSNGERMSTMIQESQLQALIAHFEEQAAVFDEAAIGLGAAQRHEKQRVRDAYRDCAARLKAALLLREGLQGPVTTFTPMMWVSMNEQERYEEYIRVRQALKEAKALYEANHG